jgi:NADPH:quinone reductase
MRHIHAHGSGWAEAALVNGVECVGRMKSCPGGAFSIGAKAARRPWGGFGRTINDS